MSAAAEPDPMLPALYRAKGVRRETADVVTLDLVPLSGTVPGFVPGQFNMLYAFGIGEVPISMSGDPSDSSRFVHTVRAVGAVSEAIAHGDAGAMLGLRGPFGSAWPVSEAVGHDVVFVAGGVGLAPLRPAIYQVLAESERFGEITLLYGARDPAELLFRDEIKEWTARPDIAVAVTVDHADSAWHGNVGVVPALIGKARFDPQNTLALVCGPEVMMRFSAQALLAAGVAPGRIFLSMERNMKCALGLCGHCQFGPDFICRDGPVFPYHRLASRLRIREI